jgi:hypothetical protein
MFANSAAAFGPTPTTQILHRHWRPDIGRQAGELGRGDAPPKPKKLKVYRPTIQGIVCHPTTPGFLAEIPP